MAQGILTLVSEELAEKGKSFIFMGGQEECADCKLGKLCLCMEKGSRYKVTAVRPPLHDCGLTGGKVRIVEVEKVERTACVDRKYAIDGSLITFFPSECGQAGCANYHKCNPDGIDKEDKVKVSVVKEKAECPLGQHRNIVTLC